LKAPGERGGAVLWQVKERFLARVEGAAGCDFQGRKRDGGLGKGRRTGALIKMAERVAGPGVVGQTRK